MTVVHLVVQQLKELFDSFTSILYILVFSRLSRLTTSSRNECAVLGNGPSLSNDVTGRQDIGDHTDVICVNNFVFSAHYELLKPTGYVVLDPYYWVDELPQDLSLEREKFFSLLEQKTEWKVTLYAPFACKKSKTWLKYGQFKNPNITVCFFNRTPARGYAWFRHGCYSMNLGMPWAQNVLVAAIFLALNVGYKKIFLFGADHSWHEEIEVGQDNILYVRQSRFYDNKSPREPVLKSDSKTSFKMHELFAAWARVFHGYILLEQYSHYRKAKIFNCSSRSYIDAFERLQSRELQQRKQPGI